MFCHIVSKLSSKVLAEIELQALSNILLSKLNPIE